MFSHSLVSEWGLPSDEFPRAFVGRVLPRSRTFIVLRIFPVLVFALVAPASGIAVEPPIPAGERARMLAAFTQQLTTVTGALADAPGDIALYSKRGDLNLFLARFPAAVADFEKMITLDPAQDAPHWRLGIAYYFTGQFEKSARQFEKYHTYENRDRENGLWKFLGDVKTLGLRPARRAMLVYTRFDREPFPKLYDLFAGKLSTREFFADLAARKHTGNAQVMFFANYYAGLHEEILGHHEKALELLHAAVANAGDRSAGNGPSYMWQVARLHYDALAAAKR